MQHHNSTVTPTASIGLTSQHSNSPSLPTQAGTTIKITTPKVVPQPTTPLPTPTTYTPAVPPPITYTAPVVSSNTACLTQRAQTIASITAQEGQVQDQISQITQQIYSASAGSLLTSEQLDQQVNNATLSLDAQYSALARQMQLESGVSC